MSANTAEELEAFRQQWKEEVTARRKEIPSVKPQTAVPSLNQSIQGRGKLPQPTPSSTIPKAFNILEGVEDETECYEYHDLENSDRTRRLAVAEVAHPSNRQEPNSALEHYERGVEREGEGSLGDSLSHYRKAYRLDAGVDRLYKNKHFPASTSASKPTNPNPSNAPVTVPNPAHHSLHGPSFSMSGLIASFQNLSIPGEETSTDHSSPPLCPISKLPSEILIAILDHIAVLDPALFARLAQVCKRLAYLVSTEDRIWQHVCLDSEFGLKSMHYAWTLTVTGKPLPTTIAEIDNHLLRATLHAPAEPIALSPIYPSYKVMFHQRPRLRFNGCYISTVNYIRPGAATASQATWNSPVLIVTYYRYLRFFRDGTCASLLTTTEPIDVVHHLTKENLHSHHAGGLPSSVMNHALHGRWKLSGDPYVDGDLGDEGIVHIETEGADAGKPQPKYIYKVMLQLKSATKIPTATRNNKLAWIGYWSYNTLTGDWAEFGLKNDRAFFWSRVKSYESGK
ncbi:MAG: hypothetical protein Q9164_002576 [Protoblastenia rupestris]